MKQKFTLVLAVMLSTAIISSAQVSKGSTLLGGNLGFSNTNYGSSSSNATNVLIAPSLSRAYKDNRVAGLGLYYRYNGNQISDLRTNAYGANVFLRQYKPLGKSFYVFIEESLNTYFDHYRYLTGYNTGTVTRDDKNFSVGIALNPGVAYDLSKRVQLELLFFNNLISAGYTHTKSTTELDAGNEYSKQNSFYASTNNNLTQLSSLNVGVKLFFGR